MPRQRISTFAGVSYRETSRCAVCGDPTWTSTESPMDTRCNPCTRDDCPRPHESTPAVETPTRRPRRAAPSPQPTTPYGHNDAEVIDRDA